MAKIEFICPDGKKSVVEAADGTSVMQAAMMHDVNGIVAECSGNAMCCTCHVYVDEAWVERLPPILEAEDALLEGAASPRQRNSRLSCQLQIGPELDGLVVTVPPRQY